MSIQAVETHGEEIRRMGMRNGKLKGEEVGVLVFIMGNKTTHDITECKIDGLVTLSTVITRNCCNTTLLPLSHPRASEFKRLKISRNRIQVEY